MESMDRDRLARQSILCAAEKLGYPILKAEQLDVLLHFVEGRDVFAVLPTGFGKSLCYACLPLAFDRLLEREEGYTIAVVVTPLLAIMKDQVASFSSKGLSAAYISGEVTDDMIKEKACKGEYQLVFLTPEMVINNRRWRKMIESDVYTERMKAFVVDEAHCVKKWGESFRSVLKRIGEVRSLLPRGVNVMALTATATKAIRLSVSRTIGLKDPYVLTRSPCKSNLIYTTGTFKTVQDTFCVLADRLQKQKSCFQKTIIYGQSFKMCADIYLYLKDCLGSNFTQPEDAPDIPQFRLVEMFTSVTNADHKSKIIQLFKEESKLKVVVATIAFGMGIDCPNVRQIIHVGLPDDICSYIQETGRAGRDGEASMVTLLQCRTYHPVDKDIKEYVANKTQCRRDFLFKDMESYCHEDLGSKCFCCDICAESCSCGTCDKKLQQFILFNQQSCNDYRRN